MSSTTDQAPTISETFTFVCPCEATVHVVSGVEQSHDCPLTDVEKQAIRDAAADELVGGGVVDQADEKTAAYLGEEPAAHPQGVDPLQLASMLCVNANNFLAKRDSPPVEKQIALAQAIATVELAQATRMQYQLNLEMAQLAVNDRNAAIAKQAGPAGIVVPSMVPQGR